MKTLLALFLFFLIATLVFPQNSITNTLGTGGVFTIKDGSTTFFTLSQSDGHITLPATTNSSLGVIFKGADRFFHDFKPTGSYGDNTFLGINSGNFTMPSSNGLESSYNTGIGAGSLNRITTGYENTALGASSLYYNTSGSENTGIGTLTLFFNATGKQNTALGNRSLLTNTTGELNTAVGHQSLTFNTEGISNTATGGFSLASNTTGNYNTASGVSSLYYNSTGTSNTTSGAFSLRSNTTGNQNTALGVYSLYSNTTGDNNTAIGYNSLTTNSTGFQNTAVGHHSLQNNTGNYNTALGYNAGSAVTSGVNLTLIGIDANPTSGTATNQITLGNSFVTSLRCNVQNISSLSDARDKKNIQDLNLGIDFLMRIKPRVFNWDKREWYDDNKSDGSKMKEETTAGFIAQELDEVQTSENAEWLNLVLKDNPEKLEATYGNLLPIIVKAIQELNEKNEQLTIQNEKLKDEEMAELKNQNQNLEKRLSKYEETQLLLIKKLEQIESNKELLKVQIVNTENNNP